MTDHELNEKMALLCGRTLFLAPACEQLYVEPIESAEELLCGFASGRTAVLWNPVELIEQAMLYVVAAIVAHGGVGFWLLHDDDGYYVSFVKQEYEDGWPSQTAPSFHDVPRAICAIALEAAKKLEETT